MSTPTGQAGTGWRITGQAEEAKLGPDNRMVVGVTVYFETQYGVPGSIWLAYPGYTIDTVREAITSRATDLDSVHTMTG